MQTRLEKLQDLNSILHNGEDFETAMWPAVIDGASVFLVDCIAVAVMRDLVEELLKEELDGRGKL